MTIQEAIRLLDPTTTVEAIAEIEYYAGFTGRTAAIQAITDATVIACKIMREYLEKRHDMPPIGGFHDD